MSFNASSVDLDVASGQATVQTVSGIVDDMQGIIRQIAATASTGMSTWNGQASRAFDSTHSEWNSAATALNSALDDIRTQLSAGFVGYEDQDAEASKFISSSGGPLKL